jgi:membrane carboxypeptidase/penicillin-binding protein PbpC
VLEQVQSLAGQNARDGALVILRPGTGEILAMVGSADFYNEAISGQVNMAISPRQPGSAIKPLTYLAAFEKGWTPSTLIWDVPSEFTPSGLPNDPSPPYQPVNYDGRFHGPVTVRTALANSYNIPAVKTLQHVGIYDDPLTPAEDGLIALARRLGITTLTRPDYGLSLTLGGGEVTLLELTSAYATLANGGVRIPPVAITRILDYSGNEIPLDPKPAGEQVVRPEHAYLLSSILSDNKARTPAFGANSVLNLPFPAAVKTGTTNDFRDNWTIGYTPDLAIGVWIGNADYTPMQNTSGLSGAAPLWNQVMTHAVQQVMGGNSTHFSRPPGVVDYIVCAASGTQPSRWCPEQRTEMFAADQPPLPKENDFWQKVMVDTWTGLKASAFCSEFVDEQTVLNVTDPTAKKWIRKDSAGRAWAENLGFSDPILFSPERECTAADPRPTLAFVYPKDGDTITASPLDIYILADATAGFDSVRLDAGLGEDPVGWDVLAQENRPFSQPDVIHSWRLERAPEGVVTLRLTMRSQEGTFARRLLRLYLLVPTPTPEPTPTPWPTFPPFPTEIPLPTMPVFLTELPTLGPPPP